MSTKVNNKAGKRTIKVTISESDLGYIADIAKDLGVSESEVFRKGLKLMAVYDQVKKNKGKIIIENPEEQTRQELLIL
ncbi:MAG: hypothetical protein AAGE96_25480 [Cyanobacteria bacterium P01_G01_bin.19]